MKSQLGIIICSETWFCLIICMPTLSDVWAKWDCGEDYVHAVPGQKYSNPNSYCYSNIWRSRSRFYDARWKTEQSLYNHRDQAFGEPYEKPCEKEKGKINICLKDTVSTGHYTNRWRRTCYKAVKSERGRECNYRRGEDANAGEAQWTSGKAQCPATQTRKRGKSWARIQKSPPVSDDIHPPQNSKYPNH